jgi:uracil-DNA glycosylase
MPNHKLAKLLTNKLQFDQPKLFNPYRDYCDGDDVCNGPEAKLARLAAHLDCDPRFILCGEAPSHRGCRHSGIAFTSEDLLLKGRIPGITVAVERLTTKKTPYKEASARVVWDALYELKIQERTILWNALPLHPYKPGNTRSNRTPTRKEVKTHGEAALKMLIGEFPSATVVAVGKTAEKSLKSMGVDFKPVRHPARGGADEFFQGLKSIVHGKRRRTKDYPLICPRIALASAAGSAASVIGRPTTM